MRRLYYITNGFPYGKSEKTFVIPEIEELSKKFDLTVISNPTIEDKNDTQHFTDIDEFAKLITLRCEMTRYEKIKYSFKTIMYILFWEEIVKILRERIKVGIRSLYALGFFSHALFFYDNLKKIIRAHDGSEEKSIYYTFWNNAYPLALIINKKKMGNPIVISRCHGGDLYNEINRSGRQPFKDLMANGLDSILFVSRYGKEYFSNNWEGHNEKLYYFPLGVKFYGRTEIKHSDVFRIVSCSNIIDSKRIDLIIQGLSKTDAKKTSYKKIVWHHFGEGIEKDNCEKLAYKLIGEREEIEYIFEGYVENDKIRAFYVDNSISCFITTTASEGSPISIQEAISAGVPIIGTNVGG